MEERKYSCKECGSIATTTDGSIPECCGKPMEQIPMNACTSAFSAEIARPFNEDEPCDDARAGIKP
jgi:hypothetical protein